MAIVLVLALDTATPTLTAGVARIKGPAELIAEMQALHDSADGSPKSGDHPAPPAVDPADVLAQQSLTDAFGHAEHLMPLTTAALAESDCALADLGAVVVGVGPGPFTGLRVGIATAAALGDGLGIPVHGVPSHDAIARQVSDDGDFLVVTDARRKEVYVTGYAASGAPVHGPIALSPALVPDWLTAQQFSPQWLAGPGAPLVATTLELPVRSEQPPLTRGLVACAAQPLITGAIPGPLEPLYLRRPDAVPPGAGKSVLPA